MAIRKQTWLWVAIGCGIAALLVYVNHRSPAKPASAPAVETPAEEPAPPPQVNPAETVPQPAHTARPTVAASAPAATSVAVGPEHGRAPCTSDEQCKGPRHAPCIEIRCVNGQCAYDESHCECVSNEDCDDGDPCTRNHCFSSTQKCIYIPIDDCKK